MRVKYTGLKYLREYARHLKNLREEDKYTRFAGNTTDYRIDQLILSMLYNPEQHHLFTAKAEGRIVGFVHLALDSGNSWELAVSVDSDQQGKGIADMLMSESIKWASLQGIENMFMHCIVENKKIQHLAKKHGLKVIEKCGSDITAQVKLPKPNYSDVLENYIKDKVDTWKNILKYQVNLFK